MTEILAPKMWVPILVGIVGVLLTLFTAWLLYFNIEAYFDLLNALRNYLPWMTLIIGFSFSILLAVIIRIAQLSTHRMHSLNQSNEDLKKEILDRLLLEESKQKLEVALLQGQKLQAMGTLAGGIAHDFNNLIYAIIGYSQMARDDLAKDSVTYNNLGKVLEACQRGQELVSRILAFSRRQQHQFDAIPLKETIEAALSLLRPTIPTSVMIHFDMLHDMTILGNKTQIHQVFVNLITNAVDAMDGEGTINIHTSQIKADDPALKHFPEIKPQDYCKIEVTDTGHGMDKSTMERIFEPFYTTKEVGKGTGLGLSIVHSIIKEHQGEISVSSQLGHGTTFMILLPEYTST